MELSKRQDRFVLKGEEIITAYRVITGSRNENPVWLSLRESPDAVLELSPAASKGLWLALRRVVKDEVIDRQTARCEMVVNEELANDIAVMLGEFRDRGKKGRC